MDLLGFIPGFDNILLFLLFLLILFSIAKFFWPQIVDTLVKSSSTTMDRFGFRIFVITPTNESGNIIISLKETEKFSTLSVENFTSKMSIVGSKEIGRKVAVLRHTPGIDQQTEPLALIDQIKVILRENSIKPEWNYVEREPKDLTATYCVEADMPHDQIITAIRNRCVRQNILVKLLPNKKPEARYVQALSELTSLITFTYLPNTELTLVDGDLKNRALLLNALRGSWENISGSSNSKSKLYKVDGNLFFAKTFATFERDCWTGMMNEYYSYLRQNPDSLLPTLYGTHLFEEFVQLNQSEEAKNYDPTTEFLIVKNIFPTTVKMTRSYDLKGSIVNRKSDPSELEKKSPVLRDLDLREHYPNGLYLKSDDYKKLKEVLEKDISFLQENDITDYSVMVGLAGLDTPQKFRKYRDLQLIPAFDESGQPLAFLFIGMIDILKKFILIQYLGQSIWYGTFDAASLQSPADYAKRLQEFLFESVFKKLETM